MYKEGQRHRTKNFEVLKHVVDRLNKVFDANEVYHHSSNNGEICSLEYLYDGGNEGFRILYMKECVWNESLEDFLDDTFGIIDFDNEAEVYATAYQKILVKFRWMKLMLENSGLDPDVKKSIGI